LIVGSFSLLASAFLNLMKCWMYLSSFPANSRSSGLRLFFVMYVCSLAMSGSFIVIGGLALHPFVMRAVIECVSKWMFFTWSPFSPCISIGRSPV